MTFSMYESRELLSVFERILYSLKENRDLLVYYPKTNMYDKTINVENLYDLASNHLFDDHPELFGINEWEGKLVRSYFMNNVATYNFVEELYSVFSELLEGERKSFIKKVNKLRESQNLKPISVKMIE